MLLNSQAYARCGASCCVPVLPLVIVLALRLAPFSHMIVGHSSGRSGLGCPLWRARQIRRFVGEIGRERTSFTTAHSSQQPWRMGPE